MNESHFGIDREISESSPPSNVLNVENVKIIKFDYILFKVLFIDKQILLQKNFFTLDAIVIYNIYN